MIMISFGDAVVTDCSSCIVVPEKALEEAGYIQTFSRDQSESSKHEYHAMSQMAYFQFQDDELPVTRFSGEVRIDTGEKKEAFDVAMVLYRDEAGALYILLNDTLPAKKMLEATYRFCTRWVRLDI